MITPLTETTFSISLENELIGKAIGKGVIDGGKIAWEIKSPDTFHGFEVYELQENGDYMLHAEYVAQDNFRTLIDGKSGGKGLDMAEPAAFSRPQPVVLFGGSVIPL